MTTPSSPLPSRPSFAPYDPPAYRMYVDEVGTHNLNINEASTASDRLLSLTGIVVKHDFVRNSLGPELDALKRKHLARHHPDRPLILHRKEMVNRNYPFEALRDPALAARWDEELLAFVERCEFTAVTVAIDKFVHLTTHQAGAPGTNCRDAYHCCLEVLVERFGRLLQDLGATGDVIAEQRGRKEDRELSEAFRQSVCGSSGQKPAHFKAETLRLARKGENIAGLQLADLIAHPTLRLMAHARGMMPPPSSFGALMGAVLERGKFLTDAAGQVDGCGRNWLP